MRRLEAKRVCKLADGRYNGRNVQKMVCHILEVGWKGDAITLLNVSFQDIVHQVGYILPFALDEHQLRKSTLLHVLVESFPAMRNAFCRKVLGIYIFYLAVFLERERKKGNLTTSSSQMGSQVVAEKFGVATCQHNVHLGSEQSIDKQRPTFHVLYLIQEDVMEVTINLVEHFQDVVELISLQSCKTLIVKIHIGEWFFCVLQYLKA